ncbi:MAG: FAD-binding oxidoreductase, partial [Gammaproteobacteria bacterium]
MSVNPQVADRDPASHARLISELRRINGSEAVLHDLESVRPYECDALSAYRQIPAAVAIPSNVEQVSQTLALCHTMGVPVVARGAGTGLSGGALPVVDGIVLSLARFNRILEIDPVNRTARVEPGVRNLAISEATNPLGLYFAPDPSSQIACTLGGNVAENSGGVHCLKYGLTVHNIIGLKVLTIDGEMVEIGGQGLDSAGRDLLALRTGSEGMLGVVMEITVKLLPLPRCARVLLAAFDNVDVAGNAVGRIIAEGIIPAGLEMMDNPAIRAVEDFVHAGYPTEAAAILLCELDGTEAEVEDQ